MSGKRRAKKSKHVGAYSHRILDTTKAVKLHEERGLTYAAVGRYLGVNGGSAADSLSVSPSASSHIRRQPSSHVGFS